MSFSNVMELGLEISKLAWGLLVIYDNRTKNFCYPKNNATSAQMQLFQLENKVYPNKSSIKSL
jgi:hypothetical protein